MKTIKEHTDESYDILIPRMVKFCERYWEIFTKEQKSKLYSILSASKDFDDFIDKFTAQQKYALKSIFYISETIVEAFDLFDQEYPWWSSEWRDVFVKLTREAKNDKQILNALFNLIDHQIKYQIALNAKEFSFHSNKEWRWSAEFFRLILSWWEITPAWIRWNEFMWIANEWDTVLLDYKDDIKNWQIRISWTLNRMLLLSFFWRNLLITWIKTMNDLYAKKLLSKVWYTRSTPHW